MAGHPDIMQYHTLPGIFGDPGMNYLTQWPYTQGNQGMHPPSAT